MLPTQQTLNLIAFSFAPQFIDLIIIMFDWNKYFTFRPKRYCTDNKEDKNRTCSKRQKWGRFCHNTLSRDLRSPGLGCNVCKWTEISFAEQSSGTALIVRRKWHPALAKCWKTISLTELIVYIWWLWGLFWADSNLQMVLQPIEVFLWIA